MRVLALFALLPAFLAASVSAAPTNDGALAARGGGSPSGGGSSSSGGSPTSGGSAPAATNCALGSDELAVCGLEQTLGAILGDVEDLLGSINL